MLATGVLFHGLAKSARLCLYRSSSAFLIAKSLQDIPDAARKLKAMIRQAVHAPKEACIVTIGSSHNRSHKPLERSANGAWQGGLVALREAAQSRRQDQPLPRRTGWPTRVEVGARSPTSGVHAHAWHACHASMPMAASLPFLRHQQGWIVQYTAAPWPQLSPSRSL